MAIRQLITFAFSSFACLTIASAAFGQVPHTFIAGTPARAAEVNENFEYLDDRVSDNVTDIARLLSGASPDSSLVIVDSLENVVGPAVDIYTYLFNSTTVEGRLRAKGIFNVADVLFKDLVSGKVFRIGFPNLAYNDERIGLYYSEPNCQGTPYILEDTRSEGFDVLGFPHLLLDGLGPAGKGIYYPTSDAPVMITIRSEGDHNGCFTADLGPGTFMAYDGYVDLEALHPPPYRLAVN